MKTDTYIDNLITKQILEQNDTERKAHVSSGKLSASMLGAPLQWQILKQYGVPERDIDDYTLRKFKRGKDVEAWVVKSLVLDTLSTQAEVSYKGVIGYVDCLVDSLHFDFPCGVVPLEVKSVSNAKFKRLERGGADHGHLLQGALYALALDKPSFAILYVASDDYRIKTWLYDTALFKEEIDAIIERYSTQLSKGTVPAFEAIEKWQADLKYCRYPDWMGLSEEEATSKLKALTF